jgi:nitrite reductase (NADH) small subunit
MTDGENDPDAGGDGASETTDDGASAETTQTPPATDDGASAEADEVPSDHHFVVSAGDLSPGERAMIDIDGLEIGVFNVDGEYHALANYCVHQGGPGCGGRITGKVTEAEDGTLTYDQRGEVVCCPWHGWEYDITTGEHLADPSLGLPTFEVVERHGNLYVVR